MLAPLENIVYWYHSYQVYIDYERNMCNRVPFGGLHFDVRTALLYLAIAYARTTCATRPIPAVTHVGKKNPSMYMHALTHTIVVRNRVTFVIAVQQQYKYVNFT